MQLEANKKTLIDFENEQETVPLGVNVERIVVKSAGLEVGPGSILGSDGGLKASQLTFLCPSLPTTYLLHRDAAKLNLAHVCKVL